MKIEVSNGEIVDKLTILIIKKENIKDKAKLKNIEEEISSIAPISDQIIKRKDSMFTDLYRVNQELWDVEDKIRIMERESRFDKDFVELARSVYKLNDRRAEIKRNINKFSKSSLFEEKSYEGYTWEY